MAMERVRMDIAKPDPNPNPNPSSSPCPTHESIYGHGCRSDPNPPDIRVSMDIHEYIAIIILQHFGILATFQQ
jgi:hypothetical protein